MDISSLRQQHRTFTYQNFEYGITNQGLEIKFLFSISPNFEFEPRLILPGVSSELIGNLDIKHLENLIFHLGLAEIPSYWKLTCSPQIIIKATVSASGSSGSLSPIFSQEQLPFWQKLMIKGMGEFYFQNQIDFTDKNFTSCKIEPETQSHQLKSRLFNPDQQTSGSQANAELSLRSPSECSQTPSYLIPVGGGKDSALSLALLEENDKNFDCLLLATHTNHQTKTTTDIVLNPDPAAKRVAKVSSAQHVFQAHRFLDPLLLELNRQEFSQPGSNQPRLSSNQPRLSSDQPRLSSDQPQPDSNQPQPSPQQYLNGHIPFSAYLSFLSLLTAYIWNHQLVLVGNESSANQGNIQYLGTNINHQYSKAYEYEADFRQYIKQYLKSDAPNTGQQYASLLRPLNELQIARAFSRHPRYLSQFASCNVNQKQGSWCHHCAKCLFVYTLLYPFVDYSYLTNQIFRSDLFQNSDLAPLALSLAGYTQHKPFDCVGTFEESRVAFYLSINQWQQDHSGKDPSELPVVLKEIKLRLDRQTNLTKQADNLLTSWNQQHFLDSELESIIKSAIK